MPWSPDPYIPKAVDVPGLAIDEGKATAGATTYGESCVLCHGGGVVSGGGAPDLRASPLTQSYETFRAVVQNGVIPNGMPSFHMMDEAKIEAMFHYVRREARKGAAN